MSNQIEKELVLKFLSRNYPVAKVKYDAHFRRAVVLDNGEVFCLSNVSSKHQLKLKLYEITKFVFACKDSDIKPIVDSFLHIK